MAEAILSRISSGGGIDFTGSTYRLVTTSSWQANVPVTGDCLLTIEIYNTSRSAWLYYAGGEIKSFVSFFGYTVTVESREGYIDLSCYSGGDGSKLSVSWTIHVLDFASK